MTAVIWASASIRCFISTLTTGETGVVVRVESGDDHRTNRLLALGVTPGTALTVLQTCPGVVFLFLCDQTELAVERVVAAAIVVRSLSIAPPPKPPRLA